MSKSNELYENAIKVAQLYYYHGLTTETIARELNFSRPKVSRLLSLAKEEGIVEIKISDNNNLTRPLEEGLIKKYKALHEISVVLTPESLTEFERLQWVSKYTANYLNSILEPNQRCGIALNSTMIETCNHLIPKKIPGLQFIQLHGNYISNTSGYLFRIMHRLIQNYQAKAILLPVPAFFDYPETKLALWQEKNIKHILNLQKKSDLLLFSINSINKNIKSNVLYKDGFISDDDCAQLEEQNVVGEIATIFYRNNGSFADIALNSRSSGPMLDLFKESARSICIASGSDNILSLSAALDAGFISELIIDEITAKELLSHTAV